jgi:peptidoglycan/xylan/chitin deacetylase (PgdA/CDA1 family)
VETLPFRVEMSARASDAAGVHDRLVLGYHAVSDVSTSRQVVSQAALREQVSELLGRGYVASTFNDAVTGRRAARTLALTFDDGERNVLEHGFPVLRELGVPATVFVPAGTVGSPGVLGWDELALLADEGWEIGSHGVSHARLTALDDEALEAELVDSRRAIKTRLGMACRSIAYPYGDADDRVRTAAARAGYTAGCTTGGTLGADVLGWPRVGVHGSDDLFLFRLKTSRSGRLLRGTPLRAPLDRAGRLARGV